MTRWIQRLSIPSVAGATMLAAFVGAGASQAGATPAASDPPASTSAATAASTAYVYWSYWTQPTVGSWAVAATGAGTQTPPDGAVIGWRYGVGSIGDINQAPRSADDFAKICGSVSPVTGKKRVGVVIDYGTSAIAPNGEQPPATTSACSIVDTASNALQVTGAVAPERTTPAGMVCGLNGYPATGCGSQVSMAVATTDSGSAASTSTAPPPATSALPTIIGGAVILVLAVGGVLMARKRRG